LVYYQGRLHRVADPLRRPQHLVATTFSPIGTLADKLRVARLRHRVCTPSLPELFRQPEVSTLNYLKNQGFSDSMIERFFRPFYSGVFFEKALASSSRMFAFVFRMLAQGDASLPEAGIGAIARQLAAPLPAETIQLQSCVQSLENGRVRLEDGRVLSSQAVVIATGGRGAVSLLGEPGEFSTTSTTNIYFAASQPPVAEPTLVLDGEGQGPVVNLLVPSQVSPSYAPVGQSLISATVVGIPELDDSHLETVVKQQVSHWFGPQVQQWRFLRAYRIYEALPGQLPPTPDPFNPKVRVRPGIYLCGEYTSLSGLQWAMLSGRQAAEAVAVDLA
jgi:phytoene dehydrogenase-like protein